jgi:hypothetical protein
MGEHQHSSSPFSELLYFSQVPTGSLEFNFEPVHFNFHSNEHDWLVVTGSDYAKFKGTGTINGDGEFQFQIWARDGDSSDVDDTFRIKIWQEVDGAELVKYDNGTDQMTEGGKIQIHTKGKTRRLSGRAELLIFDNA